MDILIPKEPVRILVHIIIILIATTIITRLVAYLLNKVDRFKKDMTSIYLIVDIINYVIYFLAFMTILQLFGIDLAGTLLSVGIVGIAVSFAAKDIISNLFSGVILILGKSIKVGETVEISGTKAYVDRISLRSTTLIDDYGVKTVVPNSTITNNTYLQYRTPEMLRVDILVGLPLNVDVEDFKDYILEKIKSYPEIAETPNPDIFAKEMIFKENRVKVSFWTKDFNKKDEYKIIITNEIRKYIENG